MSEQTLGEKIRAARKRLGWSQAKLAGKINVVALSVARWEKDKVIPGPEHRSSLKILLGLRQEDFLVQKKKGKQQSHASSALPTTLFDFVYPDRFEEHVDAVSYTGWHESRWLSPYERETHTVVMVNRLNMSEKRNIYELYISTPLTPFRLSWFNRALECNVTYDWGNKSEGAKLLAEAILAHFFGETEEIWQAEGKPSRAIMYGLAFRDDIIAQLPGWYEHRPTLNNPAEWEITVREMSVWLSSQIHQTEDRIEEAKKQKKKDRP